MSRNPLNTLRPSFGLQPFGVAASNPFRAVEDVMRGMDQWFSTHDITSFAGNIATTELYKTEDGYVLKALVPGFLKEEINVDVSKNHISVDAQKLETKAGENDLKLLSGGFPTSLSYREEIRATLDSATADATLENGVLTVTVKCLAKAPTGTKVTVR